jgi:hypothetical protein
VRAGFAGSRSCSRVTDTSVSSRRSCPCATRPCVRMYGRTTRSSSAQCGSCSWASSCLLVTGGGRWTTGVRFTAVNASHTAGSGSGSTGAKACHPGGDSGSSGGGGSTSGAPAHSVVAICSASDAGSGSGSGSGSDRGSGQGRKSLSAHCW